MRTLAVTALALVLAGCAGGDEYPSADLAVVVEHPDAPTLSYRITCGDAARVEGADLDAEAACSSLADPVVRTRLVDGPPADQMCTEIYGGPDTAGISGTLDGEQVTAEIDRANGCGIHDWDELLADLLPAARGVGE